MSTDMDQERLSALAAVKRSAVGGTGARRVA
jgi:hypothetical protein